MEGIPFAEHIIDGIYLGKVRSYYVRDQLQKAGITHVLKLYFHHPHWPETFTVCETPLDDEEFIPAETMQKGVSFLKEQVATGEEVLIVCGAGMSRSVTFILAYMLDKGYDLKEAWEKVRARYRAAYPAPAMWESLIVHYDLPYTVEDVMLWPIED